MPILAPIITLPDTIYAIEGREMNLYFDSFIRTQFSLSDYEIDVSVATANARIKQEEKRITYTPISADAGTNTLTIKVSLNNSALVTKTITLITKALTCGNGITRQLAFIGDSAIAAGKIHAELFKLFSTDVMTVTQVGTNTHSVLDSGNTARTVYHNGHGGRAYSSYYNTATFPGPFSGGLGPVPNPFYDASTGFFNLAYWQTNEGITLNADDWVLIHLGGNDVFSGMETEALITTKLADFKTQIDYITNNILTTVPGVRVGLCFILGMSTSQDAWGANYGTINSKDWFNYCRFRFMEMMYTNYNGATGISLIPFNAANDNEHNCVLTATAYNARNSTTYLKQTNALHPADSGYWQFADCIFSFLKGNET